MKIHRLLMQRDTKNNMYTTKSELDKTMCIKSNSLHQWLKVWIYTFYVCDKLDRFSIAYAMGLFIYSLKKELQQVSQELSHIPYFASTFCCERASLDVICIHKETHMLLYAHISWATLRVSGSWTDVGRLNVPRSPFLTWTCTSCFES